MIAAKRTTIVEFLAICCIFSVFLDKAIRGVYAFDLYYNYIFFILFLLALVLKGGEIALPPRWFLVGASVIFLCSLFTLLVNNMLGFAYWKQVFGIAFTSIVYYNTLFVLKFDIKRIFGYYLKFAYWVALFGVIDNILHLAGIHITKVLLFGPFLYREYSIMGEPFYLALALTPAVAYYIANFGRTWKKERFRFLIVLACYIITYSSIAIAGLGLSIYFALYLNDFFNIRKNRLILAPLVIIPAIVLIKLLVENVHLINLRLIDTRNLFLASGLQIKEAGQANSSTFALYSNYIIARDSFLKDPIFGAGLGSHPLVYEESFLKYFPSTYLEAFGAQNQQDANSKFLRLMGETGIVGLVLFFIAYIRFFAKKSKMITENLKEYGSINYAIFIYIFLCLIRNGNYINVGFFLFMFMYYVSWKYLPSRSKIQAKYEPSVAV